jgi:hypothetical protein
MKPIEFKVSKEELRAITKCVLEHWHAFQSSMRMPLVDIDEALDTAQVLWENHSIVNDKEDLPRVLALDPYHTLIYVDHNNMNRTPPNFILEHKPGSLVLHDIATLLILQQAARNLLS